MGSHGPLVVTPRLDAKVWGGTRLAQFGFAPPTGEPIGEAVITAPDAMTNVGVPLGDLVAMDPARTIGARGLAATGGRAVFPLLIKLIDANDDLSIQVHPDDQAAAETTAGQSLGKTEAWWVVDATPGSALYLGLREGVSVAQLAQASRSGTGCGHLMRRSPALRNTVVLLPAGTVHALGAGVLIYEIQQPSAITYRLDDWQRVDAAGTPRELHIDAGLAVTDVHSRPDPVVPSDLPSATGRRQMLIACRYFALERMALVTGEEVALIAPQSPQTITTLQGTVRVTADGRSDVVGVGQTVALLADATGSVLRAEAPAVVMRGWVPEDALGAIQGATTR
jgi:mannose-6-phosphate isomerase